MMVQFVLLFFTRVIFQEASIEMDLKTVNIDLKNKSTTIFHGLYSLQ